MLQPGTKAIHMSHLMESMETHTTHTIECFVCAGDEAASCTTEVRFARYLYQQGWRYETSEKLGTIGVMCPTCFKTADAERGE